MDKKLLNKTIILVAGASVLNLLVALFVFITRSRVQFLGYVIGVILAIILSSIWLWQVWNGVSANFIILLRFTLKGLLVRLGVLLFFIAGMYFLVDFDRFYFALAFLLGMLLGIVIEVWFYQSLLSRERSARTGAKQ